MGLPEEQFRYLFLYGQENYLLKRELDRLLSELKAKHSNLEITTLKNMESMDRLMDLCLTRNLFMTPKVILYYGLPPVPEDYYEQFFKNLSHMPSTHYVMIIVEGTPDKRKKLTKQLMKTFTCYEFKKLESWNRDQIAGHIRSMVQSDGFNISDKVIEYLIDVSGQDLWQLSSSLQRLETSILPDKVITIDHIDRYANQGEKSIFDFLTAFRKKQKQKVFHFIREDLKEDDAIGVLSMLSSHLRLMVLIKESGVNDPYRLGKLIGKSGYYIKQISADMKRWNNRILWKTLSHCHELDASGKSGQIKPLQTLELLCSEMLEND